MTTLQAVRDLLDFTLPVLRHQELLRGEYDEETPAIFTRDQAVSILNRLRDGELSPDEVEAWANLVEGREGIAYAGPELETLVVELANPVLYGRASPELADRWIARLLKP